MGQILINILIAGSFYTLFTLGFNLILGTVKFFHVFYGSIVVVAAYTTYTALKIWHLSLPLAVILGLAVPGILGILTYQFVYLPLKKKKASNLALLLASFGLFIAAQGICSMIWSNQFKSLSDPLAPFKTFGVLGGNLSLLHIYLFSATLLIFLGMFFVYKYTTFGRAVRAIADDEEVAKISGVNTEAVIRKVFLLGSIISGIGGIFMGFDTGVEPITGLPVILKAIIASIIGGIGNIYGGIVGAFLLSGVENLGVWYFSAEWRDLVAFSALILFLIFRPQGLFGKKA